jgi:hypothetical protein
MIHWWVAGSTLTPTTLSHRPTGPAFGRPEDRLPPVPMADMDPGLRREDNKGKTGVNILNESEH